MSLHSTKLCRSRISSVTSVALASFHCGWPHSLLLLYHATLGRLLAECMCPAGTNLVLGHPDVKNMLLHMRLDAPADAAPSLADLADCTGCCCVPLLEMYALHAKCREQRTRGSCAYMPGLEGSMESLPGRVYLSNDEVSVRECCGGFKGPMDVPGIPIYCHVCIPVKTIHRNSWEHVTASQTCHSPKQLGWKQCVHRCSPNLS